MIGYYVRDTIVRYELLESLPEARQVKIQNLTNEFKALGYIDVRCHMGPDQWARVTQRQRGQMGKKRFKLFGSNPK